jgi:hypothetical protein
MNLIHIVLNKVRPARRNSLSVDGAERRGRALRWRPAVRSRRALRCRSWRQQTVLRRAGAGGRARVLVAVQGHARTICGARRVGGAMIARNSIPTAWAAFDSVNTAQLHTNRLCGTHTRVPLFRFPVFAGRMTSDGGLNCQQCATMRAEGKKNRPALLVWRR